MSINLQWHSNSTCRATYRMYIVYTKNQIDISKHDEKTDGHSHGIIRPFYKRAYKIGCPNSYNFWYNSPQSNIMVCCSMVSTTRNLSCRYLTALGQQQVQYWLRCCTCFLHDFSSHYNDVIMSAMASQIAGVSMACSGTDQRKHQSSASLIFVRGIHRWISLTKVQ